MKRLFSNCVIVIIVFFVTTNGQCPLNVENYSVTTCEGDTKYGSFIYVDFYKINNPCTCIITSFFVGKLLVKPNQVFKNTNRCQTQIHVSGGVNFLCSQLNMPSSHTVDVQINQSVEIRAEYISEFSSGTFFHCLALQENGGISGNLSVKCGSSPERPSTTASLTTIFTTISTSLHLSNGTSSITSTTSTVDTNEKEDVTMSLDITTADYNALPVESTHDYPEKMIYIIAGTAGGGGIIVVGLVVLILILINRSRSGGNKNGSTKANMAHTNEVFDSNTDLPDNPLYLSSQPMDELGYSSDQEKQLGLPPTDLKTKKKINSNYDVPPNNKPIDHGASSMPVYAVPKRSKNYTPEVSTGNVYAEVCKPNRSTAQDPVKKKRNEDGLLYMEVEQDTDATKQANTNDKNEITEGVCYAEIKRT